MKSVTSYSLRRYRATTFQMVIHVLWKVDIPPICKKYDQQELNKPPRIHFIDLFNRDKLHLNILKNGIKSINKHPNHHAEIASYKQSCKKSVYC